MNIIIFAGGQGTRLWPASLESSPKQLLSFVGKDTLLQHTYKRIRAGFKNSQIFIATSENYFSAITKQLPKIDKSHYSLETSRKNRGPALGLALLIMAQTSSDKIFATAWADDYIQDINKYHKSILDAGNLVKSKPNSIVAIGIKPTEAHQGFCYIQTQKNGRFTIANRFTDKPTKKEAEKYFLSKNYLWNTGYFISHIDFIFKLYQQYQPEAYNLLMKIKPYIGTSKQSQIIKKYYSKIPEFDFEDILRKNPKILNVVKADFDWLDLGRWQAIKDIQSQPSENVLKGQVITHETTGSLIYNYDSSKLVSTLHVKDLIVVVTKNAVLVGDKNKTEDLKEIIKQIKNNKSLKKFL